MKFPAVSRKRQEPAPIKLTPCDPAILQWEMQQVQLAITRRAYELFKLRGDEHGHDWEDWFRAESELLRPVFVAASEDRERISVRVNVVGMNADEIRVAVEPRRILILGQKLINRTESEQAREEFISSPNNQIMRVVELSAEIDPASAVVELQEGLLRFELAKRGEQILSRAV